MVRFLRCAVGLAALGLLAGVLLPADCRAAADPNKVVHTYFPTAETGFDPVRVSDIYSATVNEAIFERLLTYDYLARPARLVPMTAESMPEVADDGRTFTFHLRKGIYFADDPAFGGRKRELTADDYVYTFKRFFDPANRSPYAFMLEGIVGLKESGRRAEKTGEYDYTAQVPGLQAPDRYTLRIRLESTDYNFPFKLAHTSYGAMAREVVEKYGADLMGHPVGTGPYMLKEWVPRSRIVLVANPGYRGFTWDFASSEAAIDAPLIKEMKGKTMPQVGRVEISIIEEPQAIWLAFEQKKLDSVALPADFRDRGIDAAGKLLPAWTSQGVRLFNAVDPSITYTAFNFRDPLIGGFSKDKIALRRAIIMAYDTTSEIDILWKKLAIRDQMPIPPGVVGYEPSYRAVDSYDPDLANRLLDYFGYKVGADGYRTLPDGKPLLLHIATQGTSRDRQFNELWQRSMERIKLHVTFDVAPFSDNVKSAKACKLMVWSQGWFADFPDGENFMQLLYGPNTGQSNNGCYESKAFDAMFEQASKLPDSPERRRLYTEMTRQMEVDGAWLLGVSTLRNQLIRPWVIGYKWHPILRSTWAYIDIDNAKR
jgi:ABC-type transport system substrate-binding protein